MDVASLNLALAAVAGVLALLLGWALWAGTRRARAAFDAGAASREGELVAARSERGIEQARVAELRGELAAARDAERTAAQAQADAAASRARLETQLGGLAPLVGELDALRLQHEALRAEHARDLAQLAETRAHLGAAQALAIERARALEQVGAQMKLEFESLSQRILDERSARFSEANQTQLGTLLNPLREQLEGFKRSVLETYDRESRERLGLKHELDQLRQLNTRLGDEATALTRALKGEQRVQGQWGEMLLERLLEASGLERGRGFELQVSMKGEDGRARPDAIVHLPEQRDLVIDAKVSLTAWERWCAASADSARETEMKAHVASMRQHVNGLSLRNYTELAGLHTVDFVLMFVPVEAAFVEAMRADDSLYTHALERNVVIVSTSTLLATLRTVAGVWRNEDRNRNALEIAQRAGRLYDKFHGFMADLEKLDRSLDGARKSFDEAKAKLTTGKGNVVSQLDTLHRLGAKAQKRLERGLLEQAGADEAGEETPPFALDPPES